MVSHCGFWFVSPRLHWWLSGKESACSAGDTGDVGLIPGLGRSSKVGNGIPLQYCCLENPMDRGAWRAIVHGVTKSWTWHHLSLCMLSNIWLCDPVDCSPAGSFVHRFILARLLEGVAISSSMGSSRPRDQTWVSCSSFIGRWIVYQWATWIEYILMYLLVASISCLENCLSKFLAHFKIRWLSFCCWVLGIPYSQLALEQCGSGLTQTCECSSLVKYYNTTLSMVGWILRCGIAVMKGPLLSYTEVFDRGSIPALQRSTLFWISIPYIYDLQTFSSIMWVAIVLCW